MCIYFDDTHIYVYSETFMKERERKKQLVSPKKSEQENYNLGKRGTRLLKNIRCCGWGGYRMGI